MDMKISLGEELAPKTIEKNKILPGKPICLIFEVYWLDWQGCLAGSSKTAPRIFIFSIALGAD